MPLRTPEIDAIAKVAQDYFGPEGEGFPNEGKLNRYTCRGQRGVNPAGGFQLVQTAPACGLSVVTIDREYGVTPFGTACPNCGGELQSACYRGINPAELPTYEWYRPNTLDGLNPRTLDHVQRGGLLMRPIEQKEVPLSRETIVEAGMDHPALGPVIMDMPEGPLMCHDAVSCTAVTAERPASGEKFVVVITAASIDGKALGTLAQFSPAEARSFAASLLGAADECDGGLKGAH